MKFTFLTRFLKFKAARNVLNSIKKVWLSQTLTLKKKGGKNVSLKCLQFKRRDGVHNSYTGNKHTTLTSFSFLLSLSWFFSSLFYKVSGIRDFFFFAYSLSLCLCLNPTTIVKLFRVLNVEVR